MAKRRRWSDEPRSRICNYVHPQAMYRNKFGSRCGPVSVTRWLSTRSHLFEHVLSSMSCLLFAQVSILSHVIVHVDRYVCVFFACVNSASHVMVHGHGVFNSVHASISAIIVWVMYLDCGNSCQQLPGSGCVVLGTTSVCLFESETGCKLNFNFHLHSEDVKAAARDCEHMSSQCLLGFFCV